MLHAAAARPPARPANPDGGPAAWPPRTPSDAAHWLEEAAETAAALPDAVGHPPTWRQVRSRWPEYVRVGLDAYGRAEESAGGRARPAPASSAAIDRMDSVMLWLARLPADRGRLVWLRARGVQWWRLEQRRWRLGRDGRPRRLGKRALQQHRQAALMALCRVAAEEA